MDSGAEEGGVSGDKGDGGSSTCGVGGITSGAGGGSGGEGEGEIDTAS